MRGLDCSVNENKKAKNDKNINNYAHNNETLLLFNDLKVHFAINCNSVCSFDVIDLKIIINKSSFCLFWNIIQNAVLQYVFKRNKNELKMS